MKDIHNVVLYKFIPMDGFQRSLESWALKCSTIHGVNDIMENIPRVSRDGVLDINQNHHHLFTEAFFSFSHKMSVPAMWGHYAASATGVCMVFVFPCQELPIGGGYCVLRDAESYWSAPASVKPPSSVLLDLDYQDERAESPYDGIDKYPNPARDREIAKRFKELLIRKAKCWEYEQEIRLLDSFEHADKAAGEYLLYSWIMKYFAGVILAPNCKMPTEVMKKLITLAHENPKNTPKSLIFPYLKNGWIVESAEFSPTHFSICSESLKDNMTFKEFEEQFMEQPKIES